MIQDKIREVAQNAKTTGKPVTIIVYEDKTSVGYQDTPMLWTITELEWLLSKAGL